MYRRGSPVADRRQFTLFKGHRVFRTFFNLVLLVVVILPLPWTNAPGKGDVVTVLFTGFNPDSPSGMDLLSSNLQSRFATDFPGIAFASQVFGYNQRQQAFDFIDSFATVDQLFLVGHSWGGNALIRLAQQQLLPMNRIVDASFQIDSVDIPDLGLPDQVLPGNVTLGFNFFQIATGPLEPQGEMFVQGATNINVEILFNDPTITHTSIDNDPRLHDVIYTQMRLAIVPEPGTLVIAALLPAWMAGNSRRRRRTNRGPVEHAGRKWF